MVLPAKGNLEEYLNYKGINYNFNAHPVKKFICSFYDAMIEASVRTDYDFNGFLNKVQEKNYAYVMQSLSDVVSATLYMDGLTLEVLYKSSKTVFEVHNKDGTFKNEIIMSDYFQVIDCICNITASDSVDF